MIRSKQFWVSAFLIAVIPLLAIDILQHYIDWQKDVREEIIIVVQDLYSFDKAQKASILDKVFERNQTLTFLIYVKCFSIILLSALSFYLLKLYKQQTGSKFFQPFVYTVSLMTCFVLIKLFVISKINLQNDLHILTLSPGESSFKKIYDNNFKGSVMYIDFWGTTCGPCLVEFRNFTEPLKEKYKDRKDINYLYVAQGNKYIWYQQIKKYNVKGYHLFLDAKQYETLYKKYTNESVVLMPHYVIVDKNGNTVEPNARQPSNRDSLYVQLDKYLTPK